MSNPNTLSCQELQAKLNDDIQLLDVRDQQSFDASHIEGAKHLDRDALSQFIAEADKQKTTVVYCYRGMSSLGVVELLAREGFTEVYNLEGGYTAWSEM